MSEDELKKFEIKWKQLYTEGIEKLFKIADGTLNHTFDVKEYTTIYT